MRRRDDKFPDNGFEAWGGYMQAKISKLEEQFNSRASSEQEKLSDIFSGICIFVNGYTTPSSEELKMLMSKHGGVYHTYQRSEDFIIASNLPDTKVKNMSLVKVVKPEWITDSIKSNRLLDYRDYLLYGNSRLQSRLNFTKVKSVHPVEDSKSMVASYRGNFAEELTLEKTTAKDYSKSPDNTLLEDFHKKINQTTKTAADPNFISEFYNNSRLHHISQLGACFKQHVNDLRETSNFVFPARTQLAERCAKLNNENCLSQITFEGGKAIMHIDMDCFFVSVGLRKRPDLIGKPVAVTHSKGGQGRPKRSGVDRETEFTLYRQKQAQKLIKATGINEKEIKLETRVDAIADEDDRFGSMSEIASCSYEARAKGIGNGMFMGAALRLCPDLQTIPYDFDGYKEVAYSLYNTVAQYTLNIEAVSCDEMYVDCTDLIKDSGISIQDFATVLREEIKNKTGCPCSTGFGGNRLQARLATKRAKPDGQFFLSQELVEDFICDIKLRDLPGVGRQTASKLESMGHQTCGSLQNLPLSSLQQHLGIKTGIQLYDQCRGRDNNPLTFHTVRKSVSAEVNYGIRFENNDQCIEFLKQLSTEVHSRMAQFKVMGKCITLKLMVRDEKAPVETAKFMGHGFCNVINKSISLPNATNDVEVITREIISIYMKLKIDCKEMRGIGIQITKLESISNKSQPRGTMNKFLLNSNSVKTENNGIAKLKPVDPVKSEPNSVKTENNGIVKLKPVDPVKSEDASKPMTPKKAKILSPTKKSPVVGVSRSSPTASGKRRGRPPKNLSLKMQTSKNLISKFLHGQNNVNAPYKPPIPIASTQALKKETKEVKTERQPGLLDLPWDKVRELLRAWLESDQTPLDYDINLIVTYMREMVVNKNIDKLNILVNFLKRRIREMSNESWIKVYDRIMEHVQNTMIAIYGKKLYVSQ